MGSSGSGRAALRTVCPVLMPTQQNRPTTQIIVNETMLSVRLHGPRDLRVERVPKPQSPGPGEVLIRVSATGICGSDLHSYEDVRIGDTEVKSPLVLGHEFSGVVEEVGPDVLDGSNQPIRPGTRVAIDPAQPCYRCELCQRGHPNLCTQLKFCGNHPDDGCLVEWIKMPGRSCHPVPDALDDEEAALLEPLGVALHAVDLARLRVGHSVAIIGAGPIGLLILQVAQLAGANPIYIIDPLDWRLKMAEAWGAIAFSPTADEPVGRVLRETKGRGVDVAIEAAWGDKSIAQAADMARFGGRLVLVGIPRDDRLELKHSTARRKGLTILLCRRMKHAYQRAINLVCNGQVELKPLVSHRFALEETPAAFDLNARYADNVVKAMILTRKPNVNEALGGLHS